MDKADVASRPVHRLLELLTGATTWLLITAPAWGALLYESLSHLVRQDRPHGRISVLLAFEEREAEAPAKARELEQAFAGQFAHFLTTFHPDRPGEVWGKSSNLAHAVPWARRALA